MNNTNKHGLKRYIESETRRKVRQDAGFGCVICGKGITEYEHIDPEWNDAKEHNPDKMTLLCSSCHGKKTRGIYSTEKILEAKKNPKCKEKGFSFDHLDFGRTEPIIQIGKVQFKNPQSLITIENESLISISSYENKFLLNAIFEDDTKELIRIEENVWHGNSNNWDIEIEGKSITIRRKKGDVALKITNHPNDKFEVEKINITFKDYNVIGDSKEIKIIKPNNECLAVFSTHLKEAAGVIKTNTAILIQSGELILPPQLTEDTDIKITSQTENFPIIGQIIIDGSITIKTLEGEKIFMGIPKEHRRKK